MTSKIWASERCRLEENEERRHGIGYELSK
jgi:hypothetical protein